MSVTSLEFSADVTFQRYSEDWLIQARLNLKASTVRFYDGHLEQHIVPALGSRLVSSLRRADCRALVTACRAKGLKATTVHGIARTLSTILSQAVDDECLPANPALKLGKYVSRQLGHKDASITLRVYAHWLPDASKDKLVNLLDDTHLSASQAHPSASEADEHIVVSLCCQW